MLFPSQWNKGFPVSAPRLLEPLTSLSPAHLLPSLRLKNLTHRREPSFCWKLRREQEHASAASTNENSIWSSFIKKFPSPPPPAIAAKVSGLLTSAQLWNGAVQCGELSAVLTWFLFYFLRSPSLLSPCSLLLSSVGGKKPFYFNIPRTSGSWSVRASGILVTLPRCWDIHICQKLS